MATEYGHRDGWLTWSLPFLVLTIKTLVFYSDCHITILHPTHPFLHWSVS